MKYNNKNIGKIVPFSINYLFISIFYFQLVLKSLFKKLIMYRKILMLIKSLYLIIFRKFQ